MIERACQFDPEAFDLLVDEYAPRVRGFLRSIVRTSDVDDMVQELFLRVVRMIGSYQHVGRFDAWIFQIARNLAHDHLRETARQPLDSQALMDSRLRSEESPTAQPMENAETAVQVEAALQRLPDAEREVILLRHFGRLTFEEIATLMNTPLGTALARSHRGLSKLRNWVEKPA